jgi:AraC-like DNA-binding protein
MKGFKHWFVPPQPTAGDFRIRGIGVREAMRPCLVNRPQGTGDWLLMMFLDPVQVRVDGTILGFPANSLIAWTPDAGHHYGNHAAPWSHSWVHAQGPFIRHAIRRAGLAAGRVMQLNDPSILERALLAMHEELTTQAEPDPVIIKNLFVNLLRSLRRSFDSCQAAKPIPERFLRIKAYLEAHYPDRLTLTDMARLAHLSVPHFCSEFKRYFETPPLEFVIRLRMHAAAHHLRNANHSISDVARLAGYEDLFYFSKLFKKRFGMSPRALRTRLAGGNETAWRSLPAREANRA